MGFELRPGIRRLFRLPLRSPPAMHADVDEELASLIAARTDSLIARGFTPVAARDEALRRLGASIPVVRDQLYQSVEHRERQMQFREHVENLVQDVRYAARGLARRPGFTIVATLTLAIGIGATTAIFSAVDVLLLRPLPYARPDELMKVSLITPPRGDRPGNDQMIWSYPKYAVFRDGQKVFSELSLYDGEQFTITSGEVERIRGESVGATYLRTLGVATIRGRDFDRSVDGQFGAPRQVILSYAFWQRRFSADPKVLGSTIDIARAPYTIIGIAPQEFRGLTGQAEIFVPITVGPASDFEPQMHSFWLVARRAPGVTAATAEGAVSVLGGRVSEAFPNSMDKTKWGAKALPLDDARIDPVIRRSMLVLFGAVALVLLIACVNVANLLLGRANTRRREIAVRLAIGAGRKRLIRLLLTESLLLALLGGVASIAVAWIGVRALGTINPSTTLRVKDSGLGAMTFAAISLDWTALAFTLGTAMLVGVAFGLVPAFAATRTSLTSALKDAPGTRRRGFGTVLSGRHALVVCEVAVALVLLAGSGLMVRSLEKLLATDPGFDGRNILTLRLPAPREGIARDSMPAFYVQLLDRLRTVPGVTDAAINNCAPLSGGCNSTAMRLLDHPEIDMAHAGSVGVHWATPNWFATMHVPLKRGRLFETTDRIGTPRVVLVNQAAAERFWGNENPVGKHVQVGQGGMEDAEVIGIVGDVRQRSDSVARPEVYESYFQSSNPNLMVFLRTGRDPSSLVDEVRRAIHEIMPLAPVYDIQTMDQRSAGATARARFSTTLLGLFAAIALSLAAIGIYGVMSLAVTARTREIGIRIALGADRGRVQRLVVGEGAALVGAGAIAGLAGALFATRVLKSLLFDVAPSDPVTYVAIVVVLVTAALLASWIPARRAARVDPLTALRAD